MKPILFLATLLCAILAHALVVPDGDVELSFNSECNYNGSRVRASGSCSDFGLSDWGASASNLGYQPAGTTNPNDPNLVYNFNSILEASYQGQFAMGVHLAQPHPELPDVTSYTARMYGVNLGIDSAFAFHPNGTTFFASGDGGAYSGAGGTSGNGAGLIDSIGEFAIPTLINGSDVNDRSGIQEATQVQPWSSIFKASNGLVGDNGFTSVNSLYFDDDTNRLCVLGVVEYDAGNPKSQDNMMCYRNADNLASGGIDGYYQVNSGDVEGAHLAAWMSTVPTAWRAQLGGRVLWGSANNGSIVSRHSVGPSLFAGTLDSLPTNGALSATKHMDFEDVPGKQLGAHYFPGRDATGGTWYEHELMNCDRDQSSYNCGAAITDSSLVVPWINDWFTIGTYGLTGFIIPGTRTYAVLGTIKGSEHGLSYKGNPPYLNGGEFGGDVYCGGQCVVYEEDQNNKYWLFDLNDILSATNPWEVFPYEHGTLPFLDQFLASDGKRSLMRNASFDLATGRLAVVMSGRYLDATLSDIVIFQNNDWVEAN